MLDATKNVRSKKQREVVSMYLRENPQKATLVLSTSFGKGKVSLDLIEKLNPESILILVNSTVLRDKMWKEEFNKFGFGELYNNSVDVRTYQFMYKQTKDTYNISPGTLVILDEVDFMASTEELSKVMNLFSENRVIGLTGFVTESKKVWFANNLPIFTNYSSSEAQDEGILNKVHYVFVKYDLSKNNKDITVNYKKNGVPASFTQSENSAYDYADKKLSTLLSEKTKLNMDLADGSLEFSEYESSLKSLEFKIRMAIKNRSNILYNSVTSVGIVKTILDYIRKQDPENKVVVFSKRTAQSEKLVGKNNVYNGSIKKHRAEAQYEQFVRGDIKVLGVCDKINRGANIPRLNNGVFESFTGSDTSAIQIQGRFMRLEHDEVATIYVLLPYYMRSLGNNKYELAETQQIQWARNMLRSTKVKSSSVWDYRAIKQDPK